MLYVQGWVEKIRDFLQWFYFFMYSFGWCWCHRNERFLSSLYCLPNEKNSLKLMKVRNLTVNVVLLVGHLVNCFSKSR